MVWIPCLEGAWGLRRPYYIIDRSHSLSHECPILLILLFNTIFLSAPLKVFLQRCFQCSKDGSLVPLSHCGYCNSKYGANPGDFEVVVSLKVRSTQRQDWFEENGHSPSCCHRVKGDSSSMRYFHFGPAQGLSAYCPSELSSVCSVSDLVGIYSLILLTNSEEL